jgi:hypothetical protein
MGQEANEFFLFLFLQRLPKELRIMLEDDPGLDTRAWAFHNHKQPGSVAAVATSSDGEDDFPPSKLAAVRGNAGGQPGSRPLRQANCGASQQGRGSQQP